MARVRIVQETVRFASLTPMMAQVKVEMGTVGIPQMVYVCVLRDISEARRSVRQIEVFIYLFFSCFSTGLVRLYIAGLPLRSRPDHWATFCKGVPNV